MTSPAAAAFLDSFSADEISINFDRTLKAWLPYEAEIKAKKIEGLYVGLLDPFDIPEHLRAMQHWKSQSALLMKIPTRRYLTKGQPAIASSVDCFLRNWHEFSGGILDKMLWNNVVVAGGAIEACLAPDHVIGEGDARLDHFVDTYGFSDIDIFPYGLNEAEIAQKVAEIHVAIESQVEGSVQVYETEKTVIFDAGRRWRKVQLIKKEYNSPADILANFDLDCSCALYTGSTVWVNPRALVAMCTLTNFVDFARVNGATYELRLAKYALRGYKLFYPLVEEGAMPSVDDGTKSDFEAMLNLRLSGIDLLLALNYWLEKASSISEAYYYVQTYQRHIGIEGYV